MIKISKNISGFTLIELMVVITIISLLLIMGPNWGQIIADQRLKGAAKDIYSNLQKARLEAISQNTMIGIQFNATPYTTQGGVGSYTVFIDDGIGGGTADDLVKHNDELTKASVTMPKKATLIQVNLTGGATALGFNSRGLPARNRIGNIQVRNSTRWYQIILSSAGNIRILVSGDGVTWQ